LVKTDAVVAGGVRSLATAHSIAELQRIVNEEAIATQLTTNIFLQV
jgi:hypothetical protein